MKKEFLTIILSTIILTTAQYFFKTGANKLPNISIQLAIAVTLYFAAAGLIILALKKRELSYVYPLLATNFIWVGIISSTILKETLSTTNWTGLILIFIGISIIK